MPRNSWKLGRVKNLHVGKDCQACGATVTFAKRREGELPAARPIQLLYPFEVSSDNGLQKIDIKLQDLKTKDQVDVQSCKEANCLKETSGKSRGESTFEATEESSC